MNIEQIIKTVDHIVSDLFMTQETKHLIYWWGVWLKRLLTTSYHIINRKAYRRWKNKRQQFNEQAEREIFPDLCAMEENDLF